MLRYPESDVRDSIRTLPFTKDALWKRRLALAVFLLALGFRCRNLPGITISVDGHVMYYAARVLVSGQSPYDRAAIMREWVADGRPPPELNPQHPASAFVYLPGLALFYMPALAVQVAHVPQIII